MTHPTVDEVGGIRFCYACGGRLQDKSYGIYCVTCDRPSKACPCEPVDRDWSFLNVDEHEIIL